jgi:glycosyltransferase involved in cell wall biosynthesis
MTPSTPTSKSPYHILMIAPTSFFSDYGCSVRILEEARILQKLGQKVTIVTYYKGRDLPDLEIVRTRPVPWREEYEVGSSRHIIGFDALLSWTSLKLASRQRFDLIHAHIHEGALIGGVLSRLKRVPLVFDFQGSMTAEMVDHNFLNPNGRWYKLAYGLERRINRLAHVILTSSQHGARLLEDQFDNDPQRIHAVPDAVNLDSFQPGGGLSQAERAAFKAALGIPPGRPVVAYLGLLTEYQGAGKLLQAAVELRRRGVEAHVLVMGYPNVVFYQRMASALGLEGWVTFTGKIPYEQAPRYLALGDVAVAPKMSSTEGSGKILNYMAMALPTVAFDVPVSREFLGGLGVYAELGNPHALADALQSLLNNPGWARSLGQRSRRRAAESYSWDQAGRHILSIYDGLFQSGEELEPHPKPSLAVSPSQGEGGEGERL